MKISTWRKGFKRYLERLVPIASFDLRKPIEYEEWICFLPPLSSIGFSEGNANYGTAVQDVMLSIRYRADSLYIELPLEEMEAALVSLQVRVIKEFQSICDLSSLIALTVGVPIRVEEYGDGLADWLVTISMAFELGWAPEAESTFAVPIVDTPLPRPITKIVTGLYKEQLASIDHREPTTRDKYGVLQIKTDVQ